ncbi:TIGR03557 family F420-dependent LLM class oxidoreductase [Streptomonospora nanhaiensis]|uniref:TIGR03557 family F420-dependent LLM class oxidoreductase n=1 Tax=Streptomonospora nanhaiensis TaxID=1323731 RepID=UPI001C9A26AD|nr:TIGR03557 family F420-dependent LLM class oxidoreductase [Streptomonospora nanhaiensis]MBX9389642.1 TIGR03557 family F420-dependent LLM class oxidoreductase [Streptomonospora nanhaiensis]
MPRIGYFLATEQHPPRELVRQARMAHEAGFDGLWISDHYHPWLDRQGQASFVWSVIGAIGEAVPLPVTTAVTCPIRRIHPAIVAQAAATTGALLPGGFALGVGTGEALNEHIFGDPWPSAPERLAMLEEAVGLMRELWTGRLVSRRGTYYTVDGARIYTLPERPPRVLMSAFGPKAADTAGRIADGLIVMGPAEDTVREFRASGGEGKPVQGGLHVCWGPDAARARALARRQWPNDALPGETSQILPLPRHFRQVTDELITEERVAAQVPCGPDPEAHLAAIRPYYEAGADEVYVSQIGPDQDGFFRFYADEVIPRVRADRR